MVPKLTIWSVCAALDPKWSKMVPKLTTWNVWAALGLPEMVRNGTKTGHLECLCGLGPEMIQNGTETDHLERLGGLGPKLSKMAPKLGI